MSRKKISGCVNAMRQYRKKEKIFLKNSLSLDIDDFRLKGWMPVKITGCFLSGAKHLLTPPTRKNTAGIGNDL
ncbi:MAG: hypothetical protein ABR911_14750 [Syntrophales bacterium]